MSITKAVIPAAGMGTRFLPATKNQPKEMLPIVDKPGIHYIVEEAVDSGIQDILIITGRGKHAIEDYFDLSPELEKLLMEQGKADICNDIRAISSLANIHYIRQKEPRGLGHAVLCARSFVGNEPFSVLLGDDLTFCQTPALKQLLNVFETRKSSVVAVSSVPLEAVSRYGVVDPDTSFGEEDKRLYKIKGLVEKPTPSTAPSNVAVFGRYVLTPTVFEILAHTAPGKNNEIQLTDALVELCKVEDMFALDFEGLRYDVGQKLGFLQATVDFALRRDDLKTEFLSFLRNKLINEELQ